MAHFIDLSAYDYHQDGVRPGTKNVGWLESGHDFPKSNPSEDLLSRLWNSCTISVVQTRGLHTCAFCKSNVLTDDRALNHVFSIEPPILAEREGKRLLLGSAEIRVFSSNSALYAAPNLIYHYVSVHQYLPPSEFVDALMEMPLPPSEKYFELLRNTKLEWNVTSAPKSMPKRFRFIKTPTGIKKIEE